MNYILISNQCIISYNHKKHLCLPSLITIAFTDTNFESGIKVVCTDLIMIVILSPLKT